MNISRTLLAFMLIIGAGGAVATGTSAFFNDTETSTGNSFTAGAIDLKIDHTKQTYNDDTCQSGCVETEGNKLNVAGAGFENPEVTTGDQWQIFDSPADGWIVAWRDDIPASFGDQTRPAPKLELHEGVLGPAAEGNQYAELDTDWGGPGQPGDGEPASVTIYQDIPTVIGTKYMIRYKFAPRPNTNASDNNLEVKWGGAVVQSTGPVAGGGSIVWQEMNVQVTATTTTTRVQFTDMGTANSLGTFVDDFRVFEMSCSTVITNGQCTLWGEKDLGDGDVFWDFDDVKPGDRGTNVVSLHVYDNDAYVCMMTENVTDNENAPIEPEQTAGDDTQDGVPNGELSDFMELFIWGDTDGDGVFDPGEGESQLYQGGFQGVAMERFALKATTTAYLGSAWCFGEQTINQDGSISCDGSNPAYNVAQTDILSTDLKFTAVQQRNNANFQCMPPEDPEPEVPTANLFATKIACPSEASLPNWGNNGPDITSGTAATFLANHPECSEIPWGFQWTTSNADPDDNAGALGGWTTFTDEDQVPLGSPIYVREVFDNDYIPFTGQNTDQDVSAELYCSTDVLHYDNWEWVPSPVENENYYCVAFNVPLDGTVEVPLPPGGN